MFRKTLIWLTSINVVVFFIILTGLSTTLYFTMQHQLISKIDRSLSNAAEISAKLSENLFFARKPLIRFSDSRAIILAWQYNGNLIAPIPAEMLTKKELAAFRMSKEENESLHTIVVNSKSYRLLNVPNNDNAIIMNNSKLIGSHIETMQFIINIDPELNMLKTLLTIIVSGGLLGFIIIVLAGFFLARKALVPIRSAWEKQQQFVADASHELRTPLSVIQANTELLLRHPDRTIEDKSGSISIMLKESKRMTKLVTTLLTLARSDSNQMELYRVSILFDQTIRSIVDQYIPLAELKHITVQQEIDSDVRLFADEERLHQLLVILLDNALKYTPEHGIVTVTCRKYANSVVLVVEDTGIGISPEDLPFIYDRFFRADKTRSRNDGGFGLGLSIAKWIVEKHDGKIRAESRPYSGTKMIVTFPLNI